MVLNKVGPELRGSAGDWQHTEPVLSEDSQGAYQVKSHSAGRGGSGVCEPQLWNPEEALTL